MRRWFKLPDWYLRGWLVPLASAAVVTATLVLIYFTILLVWPWPWAYRREVDGAIDL